MNPHRDVREAIDRVLKYADRAPWKDLREQRTRYVLGPLFERFGLDGAELCEELEPFGALEVFLSLGVEDTLCLQSADGGGALLDEYLPRRGFQETPRARRYLQALGAAPVRLYEVIDAKAGDWVEVRDCFTQDIPLRVRAPDWSHEIERHHYVAGRVLEDGDERVFSNALLQFDAEVGERLRLIIERACSASESELAELAEESGIDVTALSRLANPDRSALGTAVLQFWANRLLEGEPEIDEDGDDDAEIMGLWTGTLECDPAERATIVQRLDALPGWARLQPDEERWIRQVDAERADEIDTFAVELYVEPDQVVVEADSEEDLNAALAVLQPTLSGLVEEPFVMCEEFEDPLDTGTALERIREESYRLLLDEQLPQFGDRTPRQHVKTAEGREAVIAWLEALEESEREAARTIRLEPFDFARLRHELGLERRH
jgi:hypothetical protein